MGIALRLINGQATMRILRSQRRPHGFVNAVYVSAQSQDFRDPLGDSWIAHEMMVFACQMCR